MNRVMTAKYASRNDPEQVKQRAMNDPEVAQIMGDPGMRMILEQVSKLPPYYVLNLLFRCNKIQQLPLIT